MTSTISEFSSRGDEVLIQWNEEDPKQHKDAVSALKRLIKKGALIFKTEDEHVEVGGRRVSTGKRRGEQITEKSFDPSLTQRLLSTKPMQGG